MKVRSAKRGWRLLRQELFERVGRVDEPRHTRCQRQQAEVGRVPDGAAHQLGVISFHEYSPSS